jgi:amino acid adenylation domain-containing protein
VEAAFDLVRGPLTRVLLVQRSDREHVVVVHQHHIVTDEWSSGVLLREWSALHEAARRGAEAPLPPLAFQVAEYACAEQEALDGAGFSASRAYWRAQLAGSPRLELPILRPPTGHGPGPEALMSLRLPAETGQALRALCRASGCTMFMGWYAVLLALLSRTSGQTDFGLGAVIANREVAGTEGLLGFFSNTIVLRTDVGGDPSFRELLSRARTNAIEAYRHQALPFDVVVQDQGVVRRAGDNPLYDVSFAEMADPHAGAAGWSLMSGALPEAVTTAKDPLGVSFYSGHDGTDVQISSDTSRLTRAAVERLLGHLSTLLSDALARPDKRLSELSLLTTAELAELAAWNDTAAGYPTGECVHELFEAEVEKGPGAVAVEHGEERLTYAELDAQANRLAHHLRALGVGPEVPVGLCVERSLEMVVGLLGVLKAGGAYVPLDPAYPAERLSFMLEDAGVPVLLTQASVEDALPTHGGAVVLLDADAWQWEGRPATPPESGVSPDNAAYVIYTSGSTGKPKGAVIPHRGLVNYLSFAVSAYAVARGEGALVHSSLGFDLTVTSLFAPLLSGRAAVLVRQGAEVEGLAEGLRRRGGLRLVKITPSHLALLQQELPSGGASRVFVIGGEALRWEDLVPLRQQDPEVRIFNEYGPTEAVVGCCTYEAGGEGPRAGPVPIGRPIPNTRAYVLDGRLGPSPVGVAGELYLSGVQLARGYLDRRGLTAERFVPDLYSGEPGGRMYRTGDLARWNEEGELEFLGRIDHQVKVRGFRIELGEIESALLAHPSVRGCVVAAREDAAAGDKRLVAYVASRDDECEASALRAHLQRTLPEHMIPSTFVALEALPLSPNGKVDRKALPAPEEGREAAGARYVPPRTAIEQALVALWEDLLRVRPIGVSDDFFALGGHSLLAVRLAAAIEDRFGRALPLARIVSHPTVEQMAVELSAELIRGEIAATSVESPLVPLRKTGSKPPLFCVHPVEGSALVYRDLARALGPERPFYGLQARAVEPGQETQRTIEGIAADYLAAIREVHPHGPYHLCGWSFGGVVAFEMARQLARAGVPVGALVLLDTPVPSAELRRRPFAVLELLAYILRAVVPESDLGEWSSLDAAAVRARLTALLEEVVGLPEGQGERFVAHIAAKVEAHLHALAQYIVEPYPGSMVLLRSRDLAEGERDDGAGEVSFDWSAACAESVEVEVVPGTHQTMISPPHVSELGRVLGRVLDVGATATSADLGPEGHAARPQGPYGAAIQ